MGFRIPRSPVSFCWPRRDSIKTSHNQENRERIDVPRIDPERFLSMKLQSKWIHSIPAGAHFLILHIPLVRKPSCRGQPMTHLSPINELEQLDAFHPSSSLEAETKLRNSRDYIERSASKSKLHSVSSLRTSSHQGTNARRAETQVGSARRVVQAAHQSSGASHEADLRTPPPVLSPIELDDHSCPSCRDAEHLDHLHMCVNRLDDELVAARNAARGAGKSFDGVTARRAGHRQSEPARGSLRDRSQRRRCTSRRSAPKYPHRRCRHGSGYAGCWSLESSPGSVPCFAISISF